MPGLVAARGRRTGSGRAALVGEVEPDAPACASLPVQRRASCLIPRRGGAVPTTAEAVRRAIQLRREGARALARRFGISPATVRKRRERETTADAEAGRRRPARPSPRPRRRRSSSPSAGARPCLPLDDRLRPAVPHRTRSSLRRRLERHGIGWPPRIGGDEPERKRFAPYAIGYFAADIAEVRAE
jgi:hypothetical protein